MHNAGCNFVLPWRATPVLACPLALAPSSSLTPTLSLSCVRIQTRTFTHTHKAIAHGSTNIYPLSVLPHPLSCPTSINLLPHPLSSHGASVYDTFVPLSPSSPLFCRCCPAAASCCGEPGDASADAHARKTELQAVISALKHRSTWVGTYTQRENAPSLVQALLPLCEDGDTHVRLLACRALGHVIRADDGRGTADQGLAHGTGHTGSGADVARTGAAVGLRDHDGVIQVLLLVFLTCFALVTVYDCQRRLACLLHLVMVTG